MRGLVTNRWVAARLFAAALLLPSIASANDAPSGSDSIVIVVTLIFVVAGSYMLTHFVVGRLQKSFLVLTGIEYVLLGILLGPQVPFDIPALSRVDDLLPIVALAVGWIGLLRGMELAFRRGAPASPEGVGRLVLVQAVAIGALVTAAAHFAFTRGWFFAFGSPATDVVVGPREVWMSAGVMGCVAAAGSVQPIELLERRYVIDGAVGPTIRRVAAYSDLIAIVAFGVLFCLFHTDDPTAPIRPSATEWAVLTVGLGAVLGLLFTPFLGDDDSENGRFLAMAGIIVLASGAAYFLDLSPLLVNLGLGAVLVNTARAGPQIRATLERTKQPMTLVLLIFAGALARPVDPIEAVVVSTAYVGLRLAAKVIGTRVASWGSTMRPDYFRGLLAHGEVSVAMAISFRLVYRGEAVDLAYTAMLVSVIVNDFLAPRLLRGLLVDAGDVRGERTPGGSG